MPILIPIGVFAILFGLSMDYEVFLLSRIKEEYDRTGDNALAVADGLAKSARVITAGAAVMITVFLSFVLGQDVLAKMFGIGLASAVLIDATVVRMVLVPATMELLGDRNWWLPTWLDLLLPHVASRAESSPTPRPPYRKQYESDEASPPWSRTWCTRRPRNSSPWGKNRSSTLIPPSGPTSSLAIQAPTPSG